MNMKAWIVLLLLPVAAYAKYPPAIQPNAEPYHAAVVRVDAGRSTGSGTLIARNGNQGLVITCAHVVNAGMPHNVQFRDFSSAARLVASNPTLDLAVLHCWVPEHVEPIPLATESPQPGEAVELCGFGGRRWGVLRTTVKGFFPHRTGVNTDIGIAHISIPGESGGPILSVTDGGPRLLAVNWGGMVDTSYQTEPMRFSQGTGAKPVKWWLEQKVVRQFPWVNP